MKKVISVVIIMVMVVMTATCNAEHELELKERKTNIGDVWNIICDFSVDAADTIGDGAVIGWNATKEFTVNAADKVGTAIGGIFAPRIIVDGIEIEYGTEQYDAYYEYYLDG